MKDPIAVRNAINAAATDAEVVTLVRDFLSSLTVEESASVPPGLITTGLTSAEQVMRAALEVAQKEVLSAFDSPEVGLLREVGSVLTAASGKIASLALARKGTARRTG